MSSTLVFYVKTLNVSVNLLSHTNDTLGVLYSVLPDDLFYAFAFQSPVMCTLPSEPFCCVFLNLNEQLTAGTTLHL